MLTIDVGGSHILEIKVINIVIDVTRPSLNQIISFSDEFIEDIIRARTRNDGWGTLFNRDLGILKLGLEGGALTCLKIHTGGAIIVGTVPILNCGAEHGGSSDADAVFILILFDKSKKIEGYKFSLILDPDTGVQLGSEPLRIIFYNPRPQGIIKLSGFRIRNALWIRILFNSLEWIHITLQTCEERK